MKRPTKKRARAQAVVIPDSPFLRQNAAAIRACGRRAFDDVVEIGERLIACREILKHQRIWLAWLKAEFKFTRRHADRLIAVAMAKEKCASMTTLGVPITALFVLAKAPPETIEHVKRHIEAGKRPSVRNVQDILQANKRAKEALRANSLTESQWYRFSQPQPAPESPSPKRELNLEDMRPTLADVRTFIGNLENIALTLAAMINHDIGEAALTASDRAAINNYCRDIADHASTIAQSVEHRLKLVSNNSDNETKH